MQGESAICKLGGHFILSKEVLNCSKKDCPRMIPTQMFYLAHIRLLEQVISEFCAVTAPPLRTMVHRHTDPSAPLRISFEKRSLLSVGYKQFLREYCIWLPKKVSGALKSGH